MNVSSSDGKLIANIHLHIQSPHIVLRGKREPSHCAKAKCEPSQSVKGKCEV